MLIIVYDKLPERIKLLLTNYECDKSKFVCGLKTAFKLNYGTPYMWIVVAKDSLVLCNTLKQPPGGLWALYNYSELNSIRFKKDIVDNFSIEILEVNPNKPIINLPMSRTTNVEDIKELIKCCNGLVNKE